jgi:solute carrier family 25 (mitochondrial phosphate transporter), member 23/24/25/41
MFDNLNNIVYICSSIISGVVNKTAIAPLERLKILKQSEKFYTNNFKNNSNKINKNNIYKTNYNNSILNSLKYIYKNEGFTGLYKGNLINITRVLPGYILKFPINDITTNYILKYKKDKNNINVKLNKNDLKLVNKYYDNEIKLSYSEKFGVGVFSGLTQISLTYPLDFLRTRYSLDKNMLKNHDKTFFQYTKYVLKTEKFFSLYKGGSMSIFTYPIYVGLQFSIFNHCKENNINVFLSGALAGLIAQTLAFPGDVIKRQLQLNGVNNTKKKYKSVFDCIRKIYLVNGIRGYYTGLGVNIIKCIPGASIQFVVYDYCKEYGLNLIK